MSAVPRLDVEAGEHRGVKTIRLSGEVHHNNAQRLDDGLTAVAHDGEGVVLDLTEVGLLTSPGLGLLIKHTERLRDPDKLILAGIRPKVLEVFRALGLDQFFVIVDTVDEGADFLLKNAEAKKAESAE